MKKLIYTSVAAVAMGISGFLHAAPIDLNNSDPATNMSLTYAGEIAVAGAGTALADAGNNQDLTATLGFSVNSGAVRFVRIDLNNGATFTNAPGLLVAGADAGTISQGGAGASFVIFEFTASANHGPGVTVLVDVDGVTVTSQASVTATYRLFETGTGAANPGTTPALATAAQVAYRFADALVKTVEPAGERIIDVTTNSTQFVGGLPNNTNIAQIEIDLNGNLWVTGAAAVIADLVGATTSIIISGDFSAVPVDGNGDPDPAQVTLNGTPADSLTLTEATFTTAVGATLFPDTTEAIVVMNVTGTTQIPDGEYTARYEAVPAAGADTVPMDLGVVSELEKNGSTCMVDFVLTPNGAFQQFVRVTNKSGVAGRVFITLFNDIGVPASIVLGDVAAMGDVLGAQSSTELLNINSIYSAVTTANPTFELAAPAGNPKDKLRAVIEGEFSTISCQTFSLATDGTGFFQFGN